MGGDRDAIVYPSSGFWVGQGARVEISSDEEECRDPSPRSFKVESNVAHASCNAGGVSSRANTPHVAGSYNVNSPCHGGWNQLSPTPLSQVFVGKLFQNLTRFCWGPKIEKKLFRKLTPCHLGGKSRRSGPVIRFHAIWGRKSRGSCPRSRPHAIWDRKSGRKCSRS